MNIEDFIKIIKILSLSYSKDFSEDTIKVWYIQFKDIDYDVFKKAVNEAITKNKFMPSIAELLEICEKQKDNKTFKILEEMDKKGYFKDTKEYEKAKEWLKVKIIPRWFKEDMEKYKNIKLLEE